MIEIDTFKENILKQIPLIRDKAISEYQKKKIANYVGTAFIQIADENFSLYRVILQQLTLYLGYQYERMVYSILQKEQEKPDGLRKIDFLSDERFCLEFYSTHDDRKIYAILRDNPRVDIIKERAVYKNLNANNDDEICVVLTRTFEQITTQLAKERIERVSGLKNVTVLDLPSFLLRFYGKEAKRCFISAISHLNEELTDVIGFSITEICDARALAKFKAQKITEWIHYDYNTLVGDIAVYSSKIKSLIDKFVEQERYRTLFDGNLYSDSYITSEWFYQKYANNIKVTNFDMTAVVAGYFKSIEQLLDSFIVANGQDKVFEYRNGYDNILVGDTNYKSMLGKMHKFLAREENKCLFEEQDRALQKFYLNKLKTWIDNCRNGYFHKDNIRKTETLALIRQETLSLYFFTLVMYRFDDEKIEEEKRI